MQPLLLSFLGPYGSEHLQTEIKKGSVITVIIYIILISNAKTHRNKPTWMAIMQLVFDSMAKLQ
jgi:hypothetical protein